MLSESFQVIKSFKKSKIFIDMVLFDIFNSPSNENGEGEKDFLSNIAHYWLEFQNQSKSLINNPFTSFHFVTELPHWYLLI